MWLLGFELWTFGRTIGCSYPLSHLTSPQRLFLKGLLGTPLPLQATYVISPCGQSGIQAHTSAGQETAPCPEAPLAATTLAAFHVYLQACTSDLTCCLQAQCLLSISHAEYPATHSSNGLHLCFPESGGHVCLRPKGRLNRTGRRDRGVEDGIPTL
jgi:hypothetical protein